MHKHFSRAAAVSLIALGAGAASFSAEAGGFANGVWSPSGCGAKPEAPALSLKDVDAYNNSIAAIDTYRKSVQPYLNCLTQEANADIQAISKSANASQQAAKEANEKIQADAKLADQKFK